MGTLARVKRGDHGIPLVVDLKYTDPYLVLTDTIDETTPVAFTLTPEGGTTPTVNRATAAITDVDTDTGTVTVTYQWQNGDTDTAGVYRGEFEIDLTAGPATAPTGGYLTIYIIPDLA